MSKDESVAVTAVAIVVKMVAIASVPAALSVHVAKKISKNIGGRSMLRPSLFGGAK